MTPPPAIPVQVTVSEGAIEDGAAFCASVTDGLEHMVARLGVPAVPAVDLTDGELPADEPLALEVAGERVTVPAGLWVRAVSSQPPGFLRNAVLGVVSQYWQWGAQHGDLVIKRWLSDQQSLPDPGVRTWVFKEVVLAVFRRHPELLVTPKVGSVWQDAAAPLQEWPAGWDAAVILRTLLAAGVTGHTTDGDDAVLRAAADASGDSDDAAQWLVSRKHARGRLTVELDPALMQALVRDPIQPGELLRVDDDRVVPELRETWAAVAEQRMASTSVLIPQLQLLANSALPPETALIRFFAKELEPVLLPSEGKVWAPSAQPEQDPVPVFVTDALCGMIIPAPEQAADDAPAQYVWPLARFLPHAVVTEIDGFVHLALDAEQVSYRLSQLDESFPQLVDAAMARISLVDLTHILQQLVAEGFRPLDLVQVLDALVVSDWLPTKQTGRSALDPRPMVPDGGPYGLRWQHALAAIRRVLAGPHLGTPSQTVTASEEVQRLLEHLALGQIDVLDANDRQVVDEFVHSAHFATMVCSDLARPALARHRLDTDPTVPALSVAEAAQAGLEPFQSLPAGSGEPGSSPA